MSTIDARAEKLQSDLAAANRALKTTRQALKESELDLVDTRKQLVDCRDQLAVMLRNFCKE